MATTFDSKVAPFVGDGLHNEGDIFGGGRLYATSRSDVCLLGIPDRKVSALL
jgi:hypothetical protein